MTQVIMSINSYHWFHNNDRISLMLNHAVTAEKNDELNEVAY